MVKTATRKRTDQPAADRVELATLAPLCLIAFLSTLNNHSLQPFLPVIARDLDTTVPVIAQAGSISFLVAAFGGLVIGPLADAAGPRRSTIAGLIVLGVSAVFVALSMNVPAIFAARFVTGLGAAITVGLAYALTVKLYDRPARARALGYVSASFAIAAVVGLPVLTSISDLITWRGAVVTLSGAAALAVLIIVRTIPADLRDHRAQVSMREMIAAYIPIINDRALLGLYAALLLINMALIGQVGYIAAFFTEVHELSTQWIGLVLALNAGSYALGSIVAGKLSGTVAPRTAIVTGTLLTGLATAALFGIDASVTVALGFMVVAVFIAGIAQVNLIALLSEESRAGSGTTMVLQGSVINLGSAAGIAAGGPLLGLAGYPALGIGLAVFAFAAVPLSGRRTR